MVAERVGEEDGSDVWPCAAGDLRGGGVRGERGGVEDARLRRSCCWVGESKGEGVLCCLLSQFVVQQVY